MPRQHVFFLPTRHQSGPLFRNVVLFSVTRRLISRRGLPKCRAAYYGYERHGSNFTCGLLLVSTTTTGNGACVRVHVLGVLEIVVVAMFPLNAQTHSAAQKVPS